MAEPDACGMPACSSSALDRTFLPRASRTEVVEILQHARQAGPAKHEATCVGRTVLLRLESSGNGEQQPQRRMQQRRADDQAGHARFLRLYLTSGSLFVAQLRGGCAQPQVAQSGPFCSVSYLARILQPKRQ